MIAWHPRCCGFAAAAVVIGSAVGGSPLTAQDTASTGTQPSRTVVIPITISGSESAVISPARHHFRVWIEPRSLVPGWRRTFPAAAREAFDAWSTAGLPISFTYVEDSTQANLFVYWRRDFIERVRGRSTWWTVGGTRFERGEIEVALASYGDPVDHSLVRGVMLHEIGHLLGLSHTSDPWSIMSRTIRLSYLPGADVAKVRRLYAALAVPPR